MRTPATVTLQYPFQIVYNAYTKGAWGKEERAKNPIKKGEAFDIRIRAHDSKFQVSINHVSDKKWLGKCKENG